MEYDFENICRVCMATGVMMSIFKVNISKKIMACASVQVWKNDGLPKQICNKCIAKLHIAFQFKKQCEKSDSKLRLYNNSENEAKQSNDLKSLKPVEEPPKLYNNCVQSNEIIQPHQIQFQYSTIPINTNIQQMQQVEFVDPNMNLTIQNQISTYNLQPMGNHMQFPPVYNVQPTIINQVQVPVEQMHQNYETELIIDEEPIKEDEKKKRKTKSEQSKSCPTCGKTFLTPTKLSRHVKTHSSDLPFKCTMCHKGFAHKGNYKIHLRMHTDERPFSCSVCNKGCRQAQDLEKHMRTHTGERPHACKICPRAFSTSSNLIAHIRTHTGEKPYVCCVCQKSFCQSNELTRHMRTHTGEKSHACAICHKEFNGSSTLIVHLRTHTGEKPYVCSICKKGFSQSSCLAVHMKRHNKDKIFRCNECDRTFLRNVELTEHMLEHNPNDGYFKCNACEKQFLDVNDLSEHIKIHTG